MTAASSLFAVSAPKAHDIEAVRPHMRKHLRPYKLLIDGSEVTINGTNLADAKKRFRAMTGFEVAFIPAPLVKRRGKR